MLIMPSTDIDFQALAENIAADFFGKSVPLSDGIVKVAKERSFTPEEVKRLLEKTNTQATLHLLKTAEDKKASFTLAHLDLVLSQTHPYGDGPGATEKTASVYTGLPIKSKAKAALVKQAGVQEQPDAADKISASDALATIRENLEKKKLAKIACELELEKDIHALCHVFSHGGRSGFSKFANDAEGIFGDPARPVLDAISAYLKEPITKIACSFYDDTHPQMGTMRRICEGFESLEKLSGEIATLRKLEKRLDQATKKATLWSAYEYV